MLLPRLDDLLMGASAAIASATATPEQEEIGGAQPKAPQLSKQVMQVGLVLDCALVLTKLMQQDHR